MTDLSLDVRTREERGRHVKHLRREGLVPATLYGHQIDPVAVTADVRALERIWHRAGRTNLVDLKVDGAISKKVIIRALQINPRTNRAIHADFFAVNLREKLTADVPIIVVGESPAVSVNKIGQLQQTLNSIKVECLPADLPSQLTIDVSSLVELDQALGLSDLILPPGVTLLHGDAEEQIVKVAPFRVQEAVEEAAAADAPVEAPAAEGSSE